MSAGDIIHVERGWTPEGYHCDCEYCKKVIGTLVQSNGEPYSRLERNQYYDPSERGTKGQKEGEKKAHIAKTPLHIARWAIQKYTEPGDWVLDPTIGAGTTAVEAITQGRNVAGMEIEFGPVLKANVEAGMKWWDDNSVHSAKLIRNNKPQAAIGYGDARTISDFLKKTQKKHGNEFQLVVNNPPYSGDVSMPSPKGKLRGLEHRHLETKFVYDKTLPNLAFLKEGEQYWTEMMGIYEACCDVLAPGGHFVLGIKDMSRQKKPFLLHKMFAERMLADLPLKFVGTAFLKHHPGTLHLNSCLQRHGFQPPVYQTISVFRKPEIQSRTAHMKRKK